MSCSFLKLNLLKTEPILNRFIHSSVRLSCKKTEGIDYGGFKYYPRDNDFKDPPYSPSKFFMLKKIRPAWGIPHWEKKILKELKLDGKVKAYYGPEEAVRLLDQHTYLSEIAVVKNTPAMNKHLYKIKHLIQITPITFPDGEPNENDASCLGATKLDEYGVMKVAKQINPADAPQLPTQPIDLMLRPQSESLRRHLRMKWLSGMNDI